MQEPLERDARVGEALPVDRVQPDQPAGREVVGHRVDGLHRHQPLAIEQPDGEGAAAVRVAAQDGVRPSDRDARDLQLATVLIAPNASSPFQ